MAEKATRTLTVEHRAKITAAWTPEKRAAVAAANRNRTLESRGAIAANSKPATERFWSKVSRATLEECWIWLPRQSKFYFHRESISARRYAYIEAFGGVPVGSIIAVICGERSCVNPRHLRLATQSELSKERPLVVRERAKTHCPAGHSYEGANLLLYGGQRACNACHKQRERERDRHESTKRAWKEHQERMKTDSLYAASYRRTLARRTRARSKADSHSPLARTLLETINA